MENLTVLPYLRIYFRVLNAIEKSCFETLHTTSCVTRTALDRLCPEAGRSSTLQRNLLKRRRKRRRKLHPGAQSEGQVILKKARRFLLNIIVGNRYVGFAGDFMSAINIM